MQHKCQWLRQEWCISSKRHHGTKPALVRLGWEEWGNCGYRKTEPSEPRS